MSDASARLDAQNPWPGLRSFAEADSAYFFGREREAQALLEIVERSPVAVLYGQSGLGKTSLLRAGVFPKLAAASYLPVWVRLDLAEGAAPLARQILDALSDACLSNGIEAPPLRDGDSLWSYFHRQDADFWGSRNRLIVPVLVLDQFEELFTLGRRDAAAAERTERFAQELEAQFEQRPPASIRDHLERHPEQATEFDPTREAVRFIISLREDFLPHLDAWRERMPSMLANRFRLDRMTRAQAFDVVCCAGGSLVDGAVARDIVDFVASEGPAEGPAIDGAGIEPAILSVVCDELNRRRIEARLARITPELLSGERARIIGDFYERAFDGVADPVRDWVEDELLTASGHRDRAAWEDARRAGIEADALTRLIDRRVLHSDERNRVVWVELTHDLLTEPALVSRNARQARRAEAEVAVQESKLRQSRALAFVFALMLLVSSAAAFVAVLEWRKALEQRVIAEGARVAASDSAQRAQAEAARARGAEDQARTAEKTAENNLALASDNLERANRTTEELVRYGMQALEHEWISPGFASVAIVRNTIGEMASQAGEGSQAETTPVIRALLMRSLALAAAVHSARGDERECARYAARAETLAPDVDPRSEEAIQALAMTHYASALCLMMRAQSQQAMARYRQAAQAASRQTEPESRRRLLFLCAIGQAQAAWQRFDREQARKHLRAAQLLIDKHAADSPQDDVTALLLEARTTSDGDRWAAAKIYEEVKKKIAEMRPETRELPSWRQLAVTNDIERTYVLMALKRDAEADEIVDDALESLKGLLSGDPDNVEWALGQNQARRARAEIWYAWGRDPLASEQLERIKKDSAAIVRRQPNLAKASYGLAVAAWLQSKAKGTNPKGRREQLEYARRILETLTRNAPGYAEAVRSLAIVHSDLGDLTLDQLGASDRDPRLLIEADTHFDHALHVLDALKHASVLPSIADLAGYIEQGRGRVAERRGDREAALAAYRRAVAHEGQVPIAGGNRIDRAIQGTPARLQVARLQREAQDAAGAAATDQQSLQILAEARQDLPDRRTGPQTPDLLRRSRPQRVELQSRMAWVHRSAAEDHLKSGNVTAALRSQKQAADLMLEAVSMDPMNPLAHKELDDIQKWAKANLRPKIDRDASELLQVEEALERARPPERTERSARAGDEKIGISAPALPGDWESLRQRDMRELSDEIEALKKAGWTAGRARRLTLPFYADARLVEIDVRHESGEPGVASLVQDSNGVAFRLNGRLSDLHDYNAKHELNLRNVEQARLYLRFETLARQSKYGMFRLIDNRRDLVWAPGSMAKDHADVERLIEPFEIRRLPSGEWSTQATMQIDDRLYVVKLNVPRSGIVAMFDYKDLMHDSGLLTEQYWNGVRVTRHANVWRDRVRELAGRRDWHGVGTMQKRLIDDLSRPLSTAADRREVLAPEYVDLSWYLLLAHDHEGALAAASAGLALDKGNLPLQTNRAHALLLLGRTAEAMDIYRSNVGKIIPRDDKPTWQKVILEDLDRLERDGLADARFSEVRALMKANGG